MDNATPAYSLYLQNLSKLMEAPDDEVLGVMKESLEWALKVSNHQHYMDLMMTASHAAYVAEHRHLNWRSLAREHSLARGLDIQRTDEWIAGLQTAESQADTDK